MKRLTRNSKLTHTRSPYTTLFRSGIEAGHHVDRDDAAAHRHAFGVAVQRHPAGIGLDDRIGRGQLRVRAGLSEPRDREVDRSEEHTSELQSLMRISYAVFCLNKNKTT